MEECFTFFRSFHEVLECLSNKSYKAVMSAIARYALDGETPELKGFEKAIFLAIKPQLDASKRRKDEWYENGEDRSEHARKAAQARWEKAEKSAQAMPGNAKTVPADTQHIPDYAQGMLDDAQGMPDYARQCPGNAQRCFKEKEEVKDEEKEQQNSACAETVSAELPAGKKPPLLEREPVNDYEVVEKRYFENWRDLFQRGKVKSAEPTVNWGKTRALLKNLFLKFQPGQITAVLDKAVSDDWILSNGYTLSVIFSATVFNRLLNGFEKTPQSRYAALAGRKDLEGCEL
jgi:hypothetical protein